MEPSSSTSPSTRFTPLSTHHLSSESPLFETTLPSLLETSERLAEEAREALPYSFDECTYSKGYLRQAVWSCIDCAGKGVCYGCSISCHAEHKLVELWTKRHFRCDCPTTSIPLVNSKRRKCTLTKPEEQPQSGNEENRYSRNFEGKFCRCGRDYDPETETEAMLNCMACEDWFHESCLNLRGPITQQTTDEEDEDDEEKAVLIPSASHDGLICAECVRSHPLLVENMGKDDWMIIEPKSDGGFHVIGRKAMSNTVPGNPIAPEVMVENQEQDGHGEKINGKRDAEDTLDERNEKKPRIEAPQDTSLQSSEVAATAPDIKVRVSSWKGKGDIFLAEGIRDRLKAELSADVIKTLPFPLEDEEIYEPPKDEDDQEETLDEVTNRVVGQLPRVQAIEALHGYQAMKDKLKTMLAGHAQDGRAVSREDIEGFFEQLKAGKAR